MIEQGANVHTRNTFGESFLHVLCQRGPRSSSDAVEFFNILAGLLVRADKDEKSNTDFASTLEFEIGFSLEH
jgi:hypothetical protein